MCCKNKGPVQCKIIRTTRRRGLVGEFDFHFKNQQSCECVGPSSDPLKCSSSAGLYDYGAAHTTIHYHYYLFFTWGEQPPIIKILWDYINASFFM
ncbi:hypothetical protein XELAEV_18036181mg [Xenopus laevis]|uniref:Uncharacterized protein n=1 Tax=Xenopus laevis TaxID=8355 RepID=A0A974HCT6_XENLA|nr:hypothetical protein XELAEV_18036181mg [Xenopus laevis]